MDFGVRRTALAVLEAVIADDRILAAAGDAESAAMQILEVRTPTRRCRRVSTNHSPVACLTIAVNERQFGI